MIRVKKALLSGKGLRVRAGIKGFRAKGLKFKVCGFRVKSFRTLGYWRFLNIEACHLWWFP